MNRTRVLLADDHLLVLEALERLLSDECDVVGRATDGYALVDAAAALLPDVVVMDVWMPGLNGIDATRLLRERVPGTGVVCLTVDESPALATRALAAGASAYLLKRSAGSELLTAIRETTSHRSYVTPLITPEPLESAGESRHSQDLTVRQREVLRLLAQGQSMKEAAATLGITPRTVAFPKYRMMEVLRIASSAGLVQYAVRHAIV